RPSALHDQRTAAAYIFGAVCPWHVSTKLPVPSNITLLPLPPKSPELNPVEHLAIYARQLALKPHLQILRRHFGPLLLCLEQTHRHPWKIMSIGMRDWA